jgi:hypothetical protein
MRLIATGLTYTNVDVRFGSKADILIGNCGVCFYLQIQTLLVAEMIRVM